MALSTTANSFGYNTFSEVTNVNLGADAYSYDYDPIGNRVSHFGVDKTTVTTNICVWGLDLSGSLQGAGGVGGLLSQTVIMPTTVKSYFPLADANGK